MNSFLQDVRYGLRMLRKTPGFTVVAVLVLALAIGGTSAMFTIINGLALRPLACKHPEQFVRVYSKENKPDGSYRSFSYPNYEEMRAKNALFSQLFAFSMAMVGVNEGDLTRRSFAALISTNYFDALGVSLAAGRSFLPEEERPGSAIPSVIVSYAYWRKTGLNPALLGQTIRLNSRVFQVVGIAPEYFTGTTAMFSPEFWLPLGMYEAAANDFMNEQKRRLQDRKNHCLMLVGRLKPGLTQVAAQSQLQGLAAQLAAAYPEANEHQTFELGKLSRMTLNTNPHKDSGLVPLSGLLLGMAGAVLLIACLNLANMQLARSAARRKEIAIRLSLGGGRIRLVRQLLTEGLLLALLGGAAGLLLASWTTSLIAASLAPHIPFVTIVFDTRPDWRVLTATFSTCLMSVLLFALGPAWKLSRLNVTQVLKEQVGDELHGHSRHSLFSLRSLLVVGQLALSLALLTAAGIFAHGAIAAARANPGFSLEPLLLVETDAGLSGYDEAQGRQLYQELLQRVRTLPGVDAASLAYVVPFGVYSDSRDVRRTGTGTDAPDGKTSPGVEHPVSASFNIVGTDYFKTLGVPLLRGREFDRLEASAKSAAKVAIIDQPLAQQLFPGEEALGRQIRFGEKSESLQIVGVVGGVKNELGEKTLQAHVYVPFGQDYRSGMNLHLRVSSPAGPAQAAMLKAVRETIRTPDPQLAVLSVQTYRRFHEEGLLLWFTNMAARLFTFFGLLALFLATVGIYGVKAYVVTRRTREIGIRMALGASARHVLWMILREGMRLTALGLALGLLLALAVGFGLRSFVYGVSAIDPFAFTVAPLSLALAAFVACYLPARRATRIQPMAALRYE